VFARDAREEAIMSEDTSLLVTLNLPRGNLALIGFAKSVYSHLFNNANFPNPPLALTAFAADIKAFEDAQTKAADRTKGSAKARDAKRKTVKDDLRQYRDYVRATALTAPTTADAVAMVESAFMSVTKTSPRPRPELSATNTDVSGRVLVDAKAVKGAMAYFWEFSLDQVNWSAIPETVQASTTISGLTAAKVHYFRFRVLTREGKGDYSQVVSLLVR
jgi:hypothetical protein